MGLAALTFTPVLWSEGAAAGLAAIPAATASDVAAWQAQVASGQCDLLAVTLRGETIGFVVWGIEREIDRRAVIVNAAAIAPVKGIDMTEQLYRFARAMAEREGAKVIRFWTRREGLVRKLADRFTRSYVMECEL